MSRVPPFLRRERVTLFLTPVALEVLENMCESYGCSKSEAVDISVRLDVSSVEFQLLLESDAQIVKAWRRAKQ